MQVLSVVTSDKYGYLVVLWRWLSWDGSRYSVPPEFSGARVDQFLCNLGMLCK